MGQEIDSHTWFCDDLDSPGSAYERMTRKHFQFSGISRSHCGTKALGASIKIGLFCLSDPFSA
ncbi:hypothetical protein N7471_005800 [Penicillium samsonianum]|uniref:uncharacterized protein n=1 Tax=Penicillium samsonianum TaxID=1882272 RepID=UPI002546CC25|nr:uncharacterized protein N7471_005800 [Penicillium samsonianum]KAJ6139314.1 hypothetical protein N7471_005800 [Penicillium samsonianum]